MEKTYTQLLQRAKISKKGSFKDIFLCLENLGNPQNSLKTVHITGTNGKGSVANLLAQSCICAGLKTGLFTSPHLDDVRERILINGRKLIKSEFASYIEKTSNAEKNKLTFFETLTAAAFLIFAEKKVDIAIIEAGIGARLDVTNILRPVLTIITSIGFDHTGILGKTLGKIAQEKAGIIKPNTPCITGPMPSGSLKQIKAACLHKSAPLVTVEKSSVFRHLKTDWKNNSMMLKDKKNNLCKLAAAGRHQIINAEIAYTAALHLQKSGLKLNETAVKKAFKTAKLPGRFQIIKYKLQKGAHRDIIVDGCHNPQGVESFKENYLASPFAHKKACLLFCVSKDKDYKKIISILAKCFNTAFICRASKKRSLDCHVSAGLFKKFNPPADVKIIEDFSRAFLHTLKYQTIAAAGSFYLAGKVLQKVKNKHENNRG
jgi:dihydrofolate synthase/folylpolyglutamate synthase